MAYKIDYKKSVEKDLAHISKPEAKRILDKIDKTLVARPTDYPMLKGEFSGMRKLRVGDYRVIFVILDAEVLVLRIGHRKEIYGR
ncbi:MAG: type II toxin-antitoxin system RelE/ParE family toxin [Methylacidiphilales bacterium]|nr:type II toxin-antitoxin system RelE/ParE family toxin [Candidatus Methylacidiphilales bacterium]